MSGIPISSISSCLFEFSIYKNVSFISKDLEIALQLGDKGGEGIAYGNIGVAHAASRGYY